MILCGLAISYIKHRYFYAIRYFILGTKAICFPRIRISTSAASSGSADAFFQKCILFLQILYWNPQIRRRRVQKKVWAKFYISLCLTGIGLDGVSNARRKKNARRSDRDYDVLEKLLQGRWYQFQSRSQTVQSSLWQKNMCVRLRSDQLYHLMYASHSLSAARTTASRSARSDPSICGNIDHVITDISVLEKHTLLTVWWWGSQRY